ncbi:MAG: hypothetical protein U1E28_21645 [Beijerinckiaceae bacterium]
MAGGSVGKRKAERRDCYVKAQALVPGRDPVDCIIINFSATGARARLSAEAELPARFKLFIPSRPETKAALLRWRNGLEFGCEYSTGVADENAFFALVDRVDAIEAKLGAAPAAPVTLAGAEPKADHRLDAAHPVAAMDEGLAARLAALESRLVSPPAAAPEVDPALAERMASLERAVALLEAQPSVAPGLPDGAVNMDAVRVAIDARIAAQRPPAVPAELVERLARLEAEVAKKPELVYESGVPQQIVRPETDPAVFRKIAELEAKLLTQARTVEQAVDLSPLERKIEKYGKTAQEYAMRVERFLTQRIEEMELKQISAPAAPPPRGAGVAELDSKIEILTSRLDARSASGGLDELADRVSNLEISLLELRDGAAAPDLAGRLAQIESRQGEVMSALRNVLALLTAQSDRRKAS